MNITPMEREPILCPFCGVDRCAYCHPCSQREGEGVLQEDCTCEGDEDDGSRQTIHGLSSDQTP